MMGHMRIETTQLYAKVTDRKVDEDMETAESSRNGSDSWSV